FGDNPAEDNQTTVERLVEETYPSSPIPIVIKKKKAKTLDFPGPTIQDSEKEGPNTPSNQMELDSQVELIPQKAKESAKYQWNRIHTRKCLITKATPTNTHDILT
ncbi:hypothetical protein O181_096085, partial [Austropuccinia psidii MF-1]|nr:hypothetical protein [Austropuccinia psidii MF-1]